MSYSARQFFPAPRHFSVRSDLPISAAVVLAAITLLVLLGWALGFSELMSFVPGWARMKVLTAVALLMAAGSLFLAGVERRRVRTRSRTTLWAAGSLLALCPLGIGALALADYFGAAGSSVDLQQFNRWWPSTGYVSPLPVPAPALGLVLAGVALQVWRHPRALMLFSACAGILTGLAWLALTGLIYGVHETKVTAFFDTISLPTTLGFLALGAGLFFLRPREGLARLFTSPHYAGRLARRLVPLAVLLTLILGWLRLQAQYRWQFSSELGVSFYGTSMLIALVLVALRGARRMDRLDLARRQAERMRTNDLFARENAIERLRESEQRLVESERRFRGIFNSTFQFIGLLAPDGTLLEANQTALNLIGAQASGVLGRHFADTPWWAHSPVEQVTLRAAITRAAAGETVRFETFHPGADGSVHYVDFSIKPVHDDAGRVANLVPEGRDITERKLAETKLRQSEERFRGAFENSAIGMALVSLDGSWLRVNRAVCEIVGRTEAELLASTFQDITHPDDLDTDLLHLKALVAGKCDHYQMEKRYFHKEGHIVWILLAVTLVRDAAGQPVHFVSQVNDITARHLEAERMQAALAEKEVMLREIHHRVKNNLQVITSLLQLQSGYLKDPEDVVIFQECQARIHAMGMIHDRLYRSGNLSTIDFSAHLRELAALIIRGQGQTPERIRLTVESEPVEVNLDTAIPLGLIATELITNAYKHAFRDRPGGQITVRLARTAERELTLSVEDDGVGLPEGFVPEQARSLGLRLIRALSQQLRAEVSVVTSESGTSMKIAFVN